ncbi:MULTISPECIES: replication initiation protein [Cupriavidus]|uniref:Replication initiation protein n=1 Tax=Cupriavidus basilensis TaxID=68895 RepID=A0A643FQZ8_9BURK|nr:MULTISPECIES: replication initiation protein [Cupriavidus]KUE86445.1 Initiator Replication protein [Cupriavidus necator]NOV23651.1 RepB family plasmid replication initiator protein [Cupriavidus necator]QOT81716.1 replication initiation protein [Cupriavidus basilensis]BDB30063.1 replication initiation protein [Cupriavidus sp. P-10]
MASSVAKRVTPLQYALDLFVEMAPAQTAIHEVATDKDIGYHKNKVFARIVGLGMSARRFVDAAYFIVAQEPEVKEGYEVSLSFFKWLMRYDSKNRKHFSSVIRSVKSSMLEVTSAPVVSVDASGRLLESPGAAHDGDETDSDARNPDVDTVRVSDEEGDWLELIGRVSVRDGRIRFRVPVELQRLIKDPENSYWTSLLVTSKFTLIYARAIYDHILPNVSDERTDWLPLDVVRNLPGKSWANNAEFKYFKRDYLDKAVSQINELSDIELSYETRAGTPRSRKKDQIRFQMKRKDAALASKAAMLNSVALFQALEKEFALTDSQFERIADNRSVWTDERIQQAIEYVRWRIRSGDKVKRASGYLLDAIANDYRVSEADKEVERVQAKLADKAKEEVESKSAAQTAVAASVAAADAAAERRRLEEVRAARDYFESAEMTTREDLVRKFVTTKTIGTRTIERQGLKPADINAKNIMERPNIATSFCSFVAGELRKAARSRANSQDNVL